MEVGYTNTAAPKDSKFIYLLGADDISAADIPKNAFVVYHGHHGDVGAYYADVILPGAAYTEKSATYINTEGRTQTTRAAVAPPTGAREDWQIVRALSEVAGVPLSYDDIHTLRGRMSQISPALVRYTLEQPSKGVAALGLSQFRVGADASVGRLVLPISDFYRTDCVSRASATMAKCSEVL
jgi:NADH dehydrogenase (ubiquinone) Fe-S protein 1